MGVQTMRRVFYGAVIGMTGMALAAPFSHVAAKAASTVRVYAPATVGVVAPTTGPTAAAAAGQTAQHTQRGARATTSVASNSAATIAASGVSPAAASVASSLLSNFNGTSSNDSRKTNFNQEFEPPDQGLLRRQRLRARAGELGIPDLQDQRQDARRARPMSTISSIRDRRSSPATRAATTTPRPTRGSPPSCS